MTEEEHAALHANEFNDVASFRDLMAVAISGGLVPCPMGVLIIIYSLRPEHKERFLQCLTYLIGFSIGLGGVITAIAVVMVLFRDRLTTALQDKRKKQFLNFAPLVSAVAITLIGCALTYEATDPGFKSLKEKILGPSPSSAQTAPKAPDTKTPGKNRSENKNQ